MQIIAVFEILGVRAVRSPNGDHFRAPIGVEASLRCVDSKLNGVLVVIQSGAIVAKGGPQVRYVPIPAAPGEANSLAMV